MSEMSILSFGQQLREWRKVKGYSLQELSVCSCIDPAVLSKYETDKRTIREAHLSQLAECLELKGHVVRKAYLVDQVSKMIHRYPESSAILIAAEERIAYLKAANHSLELELSDEVKGKLDRIDNLHKMWNSSKPHVGLQWDKLQSYMRIKYSYESNRIEGNTLTMSETHLVVEEGVTIGGKTMREHLEVINHAHAIDFMKSLVSDKMPLDRHVLLQLHQLILSGIDSKHAGVFRSVPVYISGSEHKPPEPYLLEKLMEDYFLFYEANKDTLHPVILATEMKERLVTIHPFLDGNGRLSRLILNFILLSHGHTTLILKGDTSSKLRYFDVLQKMQVEGDHIPLYDLIIDRVIDSLEEHISMIG